MIYISYYFSYIYFKLVKLYNLKYSKKQYFIIIIYICHKPNNMLYNLNLYSKNLNKNTLKLKLSPKLIWDLVIYNSIIKINLLNSKIHLNLNLLLKFILSKLYSLHKLNINFIHFHSLIYNLLKKYKFNLHYNKTLNSKMFKMPLKYIKNNFKSCNLELKFHKNV